VRSHPIVLATLLVPLPALAQQPVVSVREAGVPSAALFSLRAGDTSLRAGELDAAVKEYARAVLAAPSALVPRWSLGIALSATGRKELALKQYQEATKIAEDDLLTALLLQGALKECGNPGASEQVYLDTVRRFTRPGKPGLDASGSIARLEAFARQFPESPVLALLLGDAYQVAMRFSEAGSSYRRAIALAPSWNKPRINLGMAYLAQNKPTEAVGVLGGVLKKDPNNPRVVLAMGDAQFQAGNNRGALKLYSQIANVDSVAISAATGAARANVALGEIPSAISSLQNARKRSPKDPAPVAALADIQMKTGDFKGAVDSYASALKLTEEGGLFAARPSLQRALAEAQLASKQTEEAVKTLGRALQDDPENQALWRRLLARAYREQGDLPAAEQELKRALVADPALYPQETLAAISAEGWTEKFVAGFRADLQGARTGIRATGGGQNAIVVRSVQVSREAELVALTGLCHLLRFTNSVREEVSHRRELVALRGTGADLFLLAQAQERIGENADARESYGKAVAKNDLSPAIQKLAIQRIRILKELPGHVQQED